MAKSIVTEILGPKEGEPKSSPGSLETCVHEFIEAVHARNVPDATAALKGALAEIESCEDDDEYE